MTGQELLSTYRSELDSLRGELELIVNQLVSEEDFNNMHAKIEEINALNTQFSEDSKTAIW